MCEHLNFFANVRVNRIINSDSSISFSADLSIHCEDCGKIFQFIGMEKGLHPDKPMMSLDGTEARLPIEEGILFGRH